MSGFRSGIVMVCMVIASSALCAAFTNMPSTFGRSKHHAAACITTSTQLYDTKPALPIANFEYQELRAQLEVMDTENIATRDLDPEQKETLEGYVKTIVEGRPSLIQHKEIGRVLPGSSWKLVFSTQDAVLGDLPAGTSVRIDFNNASSTDAIAALPGLTDTGGSLDYILEFTKGGMGGNRLVAKSNYTVADSDEYLNPGMVAFSYQDVKSDAFGMNIGLGWLGFVKGRTVYINTAYVDGIFWIESDKNPDGGTYYNVYLRQ